MLNLGVPAKIRRQRLDICLSCKFYKESTGSCGTLIIGNALTDEQKEELDKENIVTWYKRKQRLCGCVVKEKTKWKFERCPVNKWTRYNLTDEELKQLKAFMATLPTSGTVPANQVHQLKQWVYKLTGSNYCTSCNLSTIIQELKQQIDNEQIQD